MVSPDMEYKINVRPRVNTILDTEYESNAETEVSSNTKCKSNARIEASSNVEYKSNV